MFYTRGSIAALALVLPLGGYALHESLAAPANRVTIMYDAFGKSLKVKKDWGYSACKEGSA